MEKRIKLYKAMIWVSDSVPGERVEVHAPNLEDAKKELETKYGVGHVFNLHCEEDAKHESMIDDAAASLLHVEGR